MYSVAPYANACSYGVNAVVGAFYGNLCAFAGYACRAFYCYQSVGYFGHFGLEQPYKEVGRRAAQVDFRIVVGVVYAQHYGAHCFAFPEEVSGYLFAFWQEQFVSFVVYDEHFVFPHLVNLAAHYLSHAVLVFVVKGVVFQFEHFACQCLAQC